MELENEIFIIEKLKKGNWSLSLMFLYDYYDLICSKN